MNSVVLLKAHNYMNMYMLHTYVRVYVLPEVDWFSMFSNVQYSEYSVIRIA